MERLAALLANDISPQGVESDEGGAPPQTLPSSQSIVAAPYLLLSSLSSIIWSTTDAAAPRLAAGASAASVLALNRAPASAGNVGDPVNAKPRALSTARSRITSALRRIKRKAPGGGRAQDSQGKKQKNKRRRRNSKVTANDTASKPSAPARCLKVRVATINRLAHPRSADSEVRNERGQRGPEGCAKQAATMSIHLLRGDLLRLLALRPQGVPVRREDEDFGSRCDCAYITGGAPRVGRNQASGSA